MNLVREQELYVYGNRTEFSVLDQLMDLINIPP